jgi:hypothetical protein
VDIGIGWFGFALAFSSGPFISSCSPALGLYNIPSPFLFCFCFPHSAWELLHSKLQGIIKILKSQSILSLAKIKEKITKNYNIK